MDHRNLNQITPSKKSLGKSIGNLWLRASVAFSVGIASRSFSPLGTASPKKGWKQTQAPAHLAAPSSTRANRTNTDSNSNSACSKESIRTNGLEPEALTLSRTFERADVSLTRPCVKGQSKLNVANSSSPRITTPLFSFNSTPALGEIPITAAAATQPQIVQAQRQRSRGLTLSASMQRLKQIIMFKPFFKIRNHIIRNEAKDVSSPSTPPSVTIKPTLPESPLPEGYHYLDNVQSTAVLQSLLQRAREGEITHLMALQKFGEYVDEMVRREEKRKRGRLGKAGEGAIGASVDVQKSGTVELRCSKGKIRIIKKLRHFFKKFIASQKH